MGLSSVFSSLTARATEKAYISRTCATAQSRAVGRQHAFRLKLSHW